MSAEDRDLVPAERRGDLGVAGIAQPGALHVQGSETVGVPIEPARIGGCRRVAGQRLVRTPAVFPDGVDHSLLEGARHPWRVGGNVLDVGEGSARGQQIEQLAVQCSFALIFEVMNGEAGDDGVEWRVRLDRCALGGDRKSTR